MAIEHTAVLQAKHIIDDHAGIGPRVLHLRQQCTGCGQTGQDPADQVPNILALQSTGGNAPNIGESLVVQGNFSRRPNDEYRIRDAFQYLRKKVLGRFVQAATSIGSSLACPVSKYNTNGDIINSLSPVNFSDYILARHGGASV